MSLFPLRLIPHTTNFNFMRVRWVSIGIAALLASEPGRQRREEIKQIEQRRDQRGDVARLEQVPGHVLDVGVLEVQPVGGILQDVLHGQLAGRRQAREVLQQWVVQ